MSQLLSTLRRARESFLRGEHRFCGMIDTSELLMSAANADEFAAHDALRLLDMCSPGVGNFDLYVDGRDLVARGDRLEFVYLGPRKASEIAAVLGKAAALAERLGDG